MSSLYDQIAQETLEGRVIYPERLPKIRQKRAGQLAAYMISLLMSIAAFRKMAGSEEPLSSYDALFYVVTHTAMSILLIGLVEVMNRGFLLYEERHHVMGRYDGRWDKLLWSLFSFRPTAVWGIGVSFLITLMHYFQKGHLPWEINFLTMIMGLIISKYLKLEECVTIDNITMERIQPLDYGSGMALNFFYGYLRLVLPATGDREKGIKERIEDYIASQKLRETEFPVKKLFILIPSSTYVPTNLEAVSYNWMEAAGNLEEQTKDRAGVTSRSYKNSVYKIQDPDGTRDPVYVVAEGATPLKTLNEVIQYSGDKKEFFVKHQKAIILSFYERLRETLREHRDCHSFCELLYYVDEDEHGIRNVNVAKQILDRIEEIKDREIYLQIQRGDGM